MRDHAYCVPGGGCDRRRFLALATDIADRQAPARGGPVRVIEVSADLDALCRGDIGGCQLDSVDLGQPARQQAGLQRVGNLGSPAEHVVNADGKGKLLAELLDKAEVGDLEMGLPSLPGQRQDAISALPVGDGHR